MKAIEPHITRYADMFAALGAETRLQIVRLLLSAHPEGMVVNEIQTETGVAGSTLSHQLEKLQMTNSSRPSAKGRSSVTAPTSRRSRNCLGSCTPSAARGTKPWIRKESPPSTSEGKAMTWRHWRWRPDSGAARSGRPWPDSTRADYSRFPAATAPTPYLTDAFRMRAAYPVAPPGLS